MAARIQRHRDDRPSRWTTIEAPDLIIDRSIAGTVVIDCVSMWVTNQLLARATDAHIEAAATDLAAWLAARSATTIVVTNEVGSAIVPDNPLARRFRDVLGRVNATFATASDQAYLCVAGRTVRLDPAPW